MRAVIEVDMDNAAFEGENAGLELARILGDLAEHLKDDVSNVVLRDVNGNRVGTCAILEG